MDNNIIIWILLIILLLLFIRKVEFLSDWSKSSGPIPNTLWTFWDSDEIPDFIQKCIDSWRKFNPNYVINIVTTSTLAKFMSQESADKILKWKHNENIQKTSDLVRLEVLETHGGVWLDASTICFKSFNWIHGENSECIVFTNGGSTDPNPMIHSWFIAASPHHKFIQEWKKEFVGVENYDTMDEYRNSLQIDKDQIDNNYLLIYLCARKVYNSMFADGKDVKLIDATLGPYEYFLKGGLDNICNNKNTFSKLRKDEREKITPEVEKCVFET